ncbi:Protein of unknown function [Kosakonia oryzendophytica]|uniref:DUF2509 family protein n=1 Tax=Kosakonia oryzendophytica TaxID=1005665 RepID=A0A1C4CPK0_9ENTR|nr:DUF2509 family protein [Kosakonia oryzendophytica]AMO47363.1 YgdB like protein [Enterobacter sp. FY-07]TDT56944.1 uncharacterized protein DUF2509 [Enterobacter sp. AG5470]WBT59091.1 DUF2509 family protein [Kosakonia oryzendophytica]SCC20991.1 Protein of unknown function [Kosakonia oryzendophytica]
MNRQRGMSSLALVLLLLLLGSLMLNGLNQQLTSHIWQVNHESKMLRRLAQSHSAMEWARVQPWTTTPALQCFGQVERQWRACLRIFADETALLIAAYDEVQLWRRGQVSQQRVIFSPHGWSDFCPLKESAQCQLP